MQSDIFGIGLFKAGNETYSIGVQYVEQHASASCVRAVTAANVREHVSSSCLTATASSLELRLPTTHAAVSYWDKLAMSLRHGQLVPSCSV